jgi:hypothetical protein
MTTPEVVKCPDGHFRQAIYGIGPYIADYPEQVWLAAIVQGWCPKYAPDSFFVLLSIITAVRCDAHPNDLDAEDTRRRSHQKTDFLISTFDPGILWDDFGVRSDIVVCLLVFTI